MGLEVSGLLLIEEVCEMRHIISNIRYSTKNILFFQKNHDFPTNVYGKRRGGAGASAPMIMMMALISLSLTRPERGQHITQQNVVLSCFFCEKVDVSGIPKFKHSA